jgi:hypothetical protein
MWKFLFGALFGAGAMYVGSEKAYNHFNQSWENYERIRNSKEEIQRLSQEMIAQWAHEGTLVENLKQYKARYAELQQKCLSPQQWQDSEVIQSTYATK